MTEKKHLRLRGVFITITLLFMSVQLSVNAAIIDLVAPEIDPPALENIKRAAEYLPAIGMSLILTQIFLFKDLSAPVRSIGFGRFVASIAIFFVCLFVVTPAERWVADRLVRLSTADQRQSALVITAAAVGVASGSYDIPNFAFAKDALNDPAVRTGVLLLPGAAMASDAIDRMREDAGPVVASALYQTRKRLAPSVEAQLKPFCERFNAAYDDYRRKSSQIDASWMNRIFGLRYFQEKRDELLGYEAELKAGLPREDFIRHPDIQGQIRYKIFSAIVDLPLSAQVVHVVSKRTMIAVLNDAFARKTLDPCVGWDELERDFVGPILWLLKDKVNETVQVERREALAEGGPLETVGRQAAYAVVAPLFALVWTLIAGFIGLTNALRIVASSYLKLPWPAVWILQGLLIAFLAAAPFSSSNRVAESEAYRRLSQTALAQSRLYGAEVYVFDWALRAPPFMYPVGSFLRDYGPGALLGLSSKARR